MKKLESIERKRQKRLLKQESAAAAPPATGRLLLVAVIGRSGVGINVAIAVPSVGRDLRGRLRVFLGTDALHYVLDLDLQVISHGNARSDAVAPAQVQNKIAMVDFPRILPTIKRRYTCCF